MLAFGSGLEARATCISSRWLHRLAIVAAIGLVCGCSAGAGGDGATGSPGARRLKMGMMPKLMGIGYFNACAAGAREAADELGIDLVYDGPGVDKVEEQVKIVDRWI